MRRFFISLREEGVQVALRKARTYAGMRLRGTAPSMLVGAHTGGIREDHTYLAGLWQTLARKEAFHISQPPARLSKRRKIALIGDLNLPQCRKYRAEQLAEFWTERGVNFDYAHYRDVPRCVAMLQDATHLMEYRLQAMPVTAMYRYEARRLRLGVLYDLDDPLFSISAYETYGNMNAVEPGLRAHFVSEAPKYLEMLNGADIVTVSTPGMAVHTRLLTRRPVHVRRNFADSTTLDQGRAARDETRLQDDAFRLCFASGSRGHERDFEQIADQVAGFLAADDCRRLMILGHFDMTLLPNTLRGQVETHGFSTYDRYLRTLARADVALMPLADDIFNSCKSAARVIDAAAVGVPSLVGTVGDMDNMVMHGQTGLIASSPQGWADALESFAQNRDVTAAMGQAARADLENRWSGIPAAHIIDPEILDWVEG